MSKEHDSYIKETPIWLIGGSVNGKPTGDITYNCRIKVWNWVDEKDEYVTIRYDVPEDIEDPVTWGNEKLLTQLESKFQEQEKYFKGDE